MRTFVCYSGVVVITRRPTEETRFAIAKYIQWFWNTYAFAPSMRDIGAAVGLKSSATVQYHLDRMEHEGLLVKDNRVRSVRLVPGAYPKLCPHDWRVDPKFTLATLRIECRWCGRRTEVEHEFDNEDIGTWLRFMGNP